MQNTEKEKLLLKVNSPQLCFLRGGEIQVLSNVAGKSHSVLKVFILTAQSLLGHFLDCFSDLAFLPECFYGHSVRDWQRGGRCWEVTKGGDGDSVPTATGKAMVAGYPITAAVCCCHTGHSLAGWD